MPRAARRSRKGGFELFAAGTNNSTYHAYITSLGIPPGPGDTLRFSWSANAGLGPEIYFEIHSHPNSSGYTRYYSKAADRVDDSWAIPGSDQYMVLWQNPNPGDVNVTYTFQLLAPAPDLTVFIVFPVILAVVVLLLWVSRRRPKTPEP